MANTHSSKVEKHHHHILPTKTAVTIGVTLLILTAITVWVAHIDLGPLNFVVAMVIASFKASLVALFFMNLKYDKRENAVIFATSFVFLAIFIVLTASDLFFRGDVYVKPGALAAAAERTGGKSKFVKPWVSSPELIAHGKELFMAQCVACHGPEGKGNGPAAAALTPPPRNFTQATGWKNGRKPSQVFGTLKNGVPGSAMASFATLPSDDRWSLAHYVLSLGPKPDEDTPADLAKIGINPSAPGGGETEAPTIPVELAMSRMAQPEAPIHAAHAVAVSDHSPGAELYQAQCASCHGATGQGGVRVKNLGVNPPAWVTTRPLGGEAIASGDAFDKAVTRGLPGNLMPGFGQLSGAEIQLLYGYVKSIAGK